MQEGTIIDLPVLATSRACALSFDEFNRTYAYARKPVIITDYIDRMLPGHEIQQRFTKKQLAQPRPRGCGDVHAPLFLFDPDLKAWAGMAEGSHKRLDRWLAAFENGESEARSLYLHDWSISGYCPWILENFTIPKYFARDLLQRLSPPLDAVAEQQLSYRDDWPSLFIGAKGSKSGVHVDAFESHFWMLLLEGEKRWLFFLDDDVSAGAGAMGSQRPFLYEDRATGSFASDALSPDWRRHPLLRGASAREVVLKPGELLIVPAG